MGRILKRNTTERGEVGEVFKKKHNSWGGEGGEENLEKKTT